jgi:hypothetical protein
MKNTGVLLPTMIALRRVELQREPTRITPGVRASALARDRREARRHVGRGARLKDRCLGEGAHIAGDL